MEAPSARIPVDVLTGFLGSGKTTLLRRVLSSSAYADSAVLINEFGGFGLDHLLVERITDQIVLLQSGCVCCTLRGDISKAMADLHARRDTGAVPEFRRLIIETTGLADPTPILATIERHPMLRFHYRVGNVVTTVDGVNGIFSLSQFFESSKQVAVADRLVITKPDLAEDADLGRLQTMLGRMNPAAVLFQAEQGKIDPRALFDSSAATLGLSTETTRPYAHHVDCDAEDAEHSDHTRHDRTIRSFILERDEPVEWSVFGVWLTMLLHAHGTDILRVKGLLNIRDSETPVVIQGVQHLVHVPSHLEAWPSGKRKTRLVFIARNLDPAAIEYSFTTFQSLGRANARSGASSASA
jgi:G3E family GTPase